MSRILIVETSVDHYKGAGRATGVWLSEVTTPYDVLSNAGAQVEFASTKGGKVPIDPVSLKADKRTLELYNDPQLRGAAFERSQSLGEVDPARYDAVLFAGGHGAVWDFAGSREVRRVGEAVYAAGGIVSSVCHGEAALLNLHGPDGELIVAGRKVTGFTNAEERLNGTLKAMPYLAQTELEKRGAQFARRLPFTVHALADGQLVTGQNPRSATRTSKLVVEQLRAAGR